MSKKKGMSIEEKIAKCEEFFHEHQVPFTLKELMVAIPKAKGVIFQSVEECLEVLISEGRIRQEKIGISVFYWYFPVNQKGKEQAMGQSLMAKAEQLRAQIAVKKAQIEEVVQTKFEGNLELIEESKRLTEVLRQETITQRNLEREIAQFADRDPVVLERLHEAYAIALEAANRWTDNIFLIEDYVTKRMGMSRKEFRERANIPAQLDFIDG